MRALKADARSKA